MKRITATKCAMLALGLALFALTHMAISQPASKSPATAKSSSGGVDKAYLQTIWDGWGKLDAAGQKQFYAQGPHVFFDDEPLKFSSWDEYQATTSKELAEYQSGRFTVNDDAQIHKSGDVYWITATVAAEMMQKSGKREQPTFRWTAIFEKQNGRWLIVHEHISVPSQ